MVRMVRSSKMMSSKIERRQRLHYSYSGYVASDHTIKVWSFEHVLEDADQEAALKTKAVVAAHDKDINSLAISPNDGLVCSGSEDRTACIWRLPDLVSLVVLKGHKRGIWSVEFSLAEQCVLTSSGDRTIKIWAISDGSCLKTFEGHPSSVLRASFLSRGTQFVSCGGEGLVKLWTIKSNGCIATYDQHEGKVWALAVGKKTEMLATGGTDAVVNLWHDCTAEDKQEAFRKEEETILRGQELENAVSDSDYTKAIQLAFELRRPHRLFDLFSQLCRKVDGEDLIEKALFGSLIHFTCDCPIHRIGLLNWRKFSHLKEKESSISMHLTERNSRTRCCCGMAQD